MSTLQPLVLLIVCLWAPSLCLRKDAKTATQLRENSNGPEIRSGFASMRPTRSDLQRLTDMVDLMEDPSVHLYEAQMLAVDGEVGRFRFFHATNLTNAPNPANTNPASDLGALVNFYGSGTWDGFENKVVGEYHVDIHGFGDKAGHEKFFGKYQTFHDRVISTQMQPGYCGVTPASGLDKTWYTGGWYSLPSLGECRDNILGKGVCRWALQSQQRLVEYKCVQKRIFTALYPRSGSNVTSGEQFDMLKQRFSGDRMLENYLDWGVALREFLGAFRRDAGCPQVTTGTLTQ